MRRSAFTLTFAFMLMVGACTAATAQDNSMPSEKQRMMKQQKEQREALKQRKKNQIEMMNNTNLPKDRRAEAMRQLKREKRQMKAQQKDEREDFKARQRQIKAINANVGN